jgi:hypothetical protein
MLVSLSMAGNANTKKVVFIETQLRVCNHFLQMMNLGRQCEMTFRKAQLAKVRISLQRLDSDSSPIVVISA